MVWSHIRGHDDRIAQLQQALQANRLGHAYLFVGPEGIGKRLVATAFSKALLCEQPGNTLQACGICPACKLVASQTHPDLLTVTTPEDKHELPIELIRQTCENLALKPVRGNRRVAIIEDADDFNEESGNAFLKTLEEPPPGAVLILLATSTDQLLSTILSRSQVLRFKPLSRVDLKAIVANQLSEDRWPEGRETQLLQLAQGRADLAMALVDDEFWGVLEEIRTALQSDRGDAVALGQRLIALVESAGKESALQRKRASQCVAFMQQLLRQQLHVATRTNAVVSVERSLRAMEACVQSEWYIQRRVQLTVLLEELAVRVTAL
jgi:DNA polymerase-3 subunit delta'